MLVKKYGNRRLYDTAKSRYITLEELAAIVRGGADVKVVDAKTGEDLTTPTLAQIIIEGRGAARLLPLPLLVQLIRMGDDALAEFFGQYLGWALTAYLQTRQRARALNPFGAFFTPPFPGDLSSMFGIGAAKRASKQAPAAAAPPAPSELQALRRELDQLKKSLKNRRR